MKKTILASLLLSIMVPAMANIPVTQVSKDVIAEAKKCYKDYADVMSVREINSDNKLRLLESCPYETKKILINFNSAKEARPIIDRVVKNALEDSVREANNRDREREMFKNLIDLY